MARMVERDKWILYKHTCSFELIKAVALDVKNSCAADISDVERHRMQERLAALNLYATRNPKEKPLDSINHRINTLEFYMFGYEEKDDSRKRFIFSPLGNLFLNNINDDEKLRLIFCAMLFGIQFEHPANGTPNCFQLYPFRLIFKLMRDERLGKRLYNDEYSFLVPFVQSMSAQSYEELVESILRFRSLSRDEKIELFKADEHTYVNCVYEWQYYTQTLLVQAGILQVEEGEPMVKLFHPMKEQTIERMRAVGKEPKPTGRMLKDGYAEIHPDIVDFVETLLDAHPFDICPVRLDDGDRMMMDCIKEIYSFYPRALAQRIGEDDELQVQLLELPRLIEEYSKNPENETAYQFEAVLEEGLNMFVNVEARRIGGAGHTDIECLYLTRNKKFAVEAKSTANKLSGINSGRLREHRNEIGGEYTIVITPRYVPAVKRDIKGSPIVIVLANTFSEYLYNHIQHDVRDIDYEDFDSIIESHLGEDISRLISDMTMSKFATRA